LQETMIGHYESLGIFSFCFFGSTTAELTWHVVGTLDSSSLAHGQLEFHLHTTRRFEIGPFVAQEGAILVNHHPWARP